MNLGWKAVLSAEPGDMGFFLNEGRSG